MAAGSPFHLGMTHNLCIGTNVPSLQSSGILPCRSSTRCCARVPSGGWYGLPAVKASLSGRFFCLGSHLNPFRDSFFGPLQFGPSSPGVSPAHNPYGKTSKSAAPGLERMQTYSSGRFFSQLKKFDEDAGGRFRFLWMLSALVFCVHSFICTVRECVGVG